MEENFTFHPKKDINIFCIDNAYHNKNNNEKKIANRNEKKDQKKINMN